MQTLKSNINAKDLIDSITDTSHSINKLYWPLYRKTHVTAADSTIVIQSGSVLTDNRPHCEPSEREEVAVRHITIHSMLKTHCMSQVEKGEINNDNCFSRPKQSTPSALYELNPAAWIQSHSRQTLAPLWWRKYMCGSVLVSVRRRLRGWDICHSCHCLICWNVGSPRHQSVYSPRGFLGLLSATVFPKHRVYYATVVSPSPVYCKTNSSTPEAKPGVSASLWKVGTRAATNVSFHYRSIIWSAIFFFFENKNHNFLKSH